MYKKRKYSQVTKLIGPVTKQQFMSRKTKIPRNLTSQFYGRYSGINSELKFFDTALSNTTDSTGELFSTSINLIPQGITESTRVGRKCVIKNISMKGFVTGPTTVGLDAFQLVLVWDKQANGANAGYTDIFTSSAYNSFNNLANSSRFIILKKFRVTLAAQTVIVTGPAYTNQIKLLQFDKKCNIPLEFSGSTGAITEIKSNNLAWYCIALSDDLSSITMTTRIRFSDGS